MIAARRSVPSVTNNSVSSNYVYDASGNLTSDGAHNYQYDAENRIAKVDAGTGNEASYFYDANNWRVKKTTSNNTYTTYYVWEGAQVIAEYTNAPAGSGTSYYLADRLSTRMITDSSGAFKGTQDHLPFGEEAGTGVGTSEKHRFTSYERDSESGTDYAINRQHQYANGRLMQPDVVAGSILAPQSLNRYSYSLNDPANLSDPLGLDPYTEVYVDGLRVMRELHGFVFNLLATGALGFEMPPGAFKNPRGQWVYDDHIINETWRFLPIGYVGVAQKIVVQEDACAAIAERAQYIANRARFALGHTKAAVEQFDREFSQAYLGNDGIGKTYKSAWAFFNARIQPQVRRSQLGESGFKPKFQDHEGDQTHHFAAFLSAGINNQVLAAALHMLTDINNQADKSLGRAAFELGGRLSDNPGALATVGERIRNEICQ